MGNAARCWPIMRKAISIHAEPVVCAISSILSTRKLGTWGRISLVSRRAGDNRGNKMDATLSAATGSAFVDWVVTVCVLCTDAWSHTRTETRAGHTVSLFFIPSFESGSFSLWSWSSCFPDRLAVRELQQFYLYPCTVVVCVRSGSAYVGVRIQNSSLLGKHS